MTATIYTLAKLLHSASSLEQPERRMVVKQVLKEVWELGDADEASLLLTLAGTVLASKPRVNLQTAGQWVDGARKKRLVKAPGVDVGSMEAALSI